MRIGSSDKSSLAAAFTKLLPVVRSRAVRPSDVVAPPEREIERARRDEQRATAGGAANHSNDEPEIRRRYQDRPFAQQYLRAYEGPLRPSTLAAGIIARRERRCVARALSACQPPPAVLLDMPCGTGKLAPVLPSMATHVVGADLSIAMMELARAAYQSSHFCGFVCGSAERLPFRTAAFDTVVCLRFMHLVPPAARREILQELARVTTRRVIISFGIGTRFQLLRLKLRRAIVRGTPAPYPARFADLQNEIEAAGLRVARWRTILPIFSCEYLMTLEKKCA